MKASSVLALYETYLKRAGLTPTFYLAKATTFIRSRLKPGQNISRSIDREINGKSKNYIFVLEKFQLFLERKKINSISNDLPTLGEIRTKQWDQHREYILKRNKTKKNNPVLSLPILLKIRNRFAKGSRDQAIFTLFALQGLRREEIYKLKWDDIDFRNRTIQISKRKVHLFSHVHDSLGYYKASQGGQIRTYIFPRLTLRTIDVVAKRAAVLGGVNKSLYTTRYWRLNVIKLLIAKHDLRLVIQVFGIISMKELPTEVKLLRGEI